MHRTFIPAILLPVPWFAIPTYFSFRIFEHGLQWRALFVEFSLSAMWSAILVCIFGAVVSAFTAMSVTDLSRNQHPFIKMLKRRLRGK